MAVRASIRTNFAESAAPLMRLRQLRSLVSEIWDAVVTDDCVDLAAEMSYYFSLSLFPFLIVLAVFVGWLPSTSLWHSLAQWITNYLPRDSRRMVFTTILNLTQASTGFLSFGLIATVWTASSGFVSLMESLSVAYGAKETRGFWKKRFMAIGATLVGIVFVVISFGLLTLGRLAAASISLHLGTLLRFQIPWELGRWLASLLLMFLGLSLINYFLPDVKRPLRWVTPGTVFVVVTMVAGSAVLNFYLRNFGSYPKFYGTMAGFIILMLWIYLASLILLIGAEADSVIERMRLRGSTSPRLWSGEPRP